MKLLYPLTYFLLIISCQGFAKVDIPAAQIQHCINSICETQHLSGVQVSIKKTDSGELWNFSTGYKKVQTKEPLKIDHLMQIGSTTKSFIAGLALQIEAESERGSLGVEFNIDQTIGHWLPQYPEWKTIKIRQLLNMTSGIFNYTDDNTLFLEMLKSPQRIWSDIELVAFAYSQEPKTLFTAGSQFEYSNTNYILVGMILEKVTGQQLETLIDQHILKKYPEHFKFTSYSPKTYPLDEIENMAHGYLTSSKKHPEFIQEDITEISLSWAGAAGALTSTAGDLANWLHLLFSKDFFPEKQRNEFESLVCTDKDGLATPLSNDSKLVGYGLGIGRLYDPDHGYVWTHTGGTLGYHTLFIYLPQRSVVITVIINQMGPKIDGGSDVNFIAEQIISLIKFSEVL